MSSLTLANRLTALWLLWAAVASGYLEASAASGSPLQDERRVGVLTSESNRSKYWQQGMYVGSLTYWLEKNGFAWTRLDDAAASDADRLRQFTSVVAVYTYTLPDGVSSALAAYVDGGGTLVWLDGPTLIEDERLLAVLGVVQGSGQWWAGKPREVRVMIQGNHRFLEGMRPFPTFGFGNSFRTLTPSAEVLAKFLGGATEGLPAVVLNHSGRGQSLLINWLPWASPQALWLVRRALNEAWFRSPPSASPRTSSAGHRSVCSADFSLERGYAIPPEPVQVMVEACFAQAEVAANRQIPLVVQMVEPRSGRVVRSVVRTERLLASPARAQVPLGFVVKTLSVATRGLPLGRYLFRCQAGSRTEGLRREFPVALVSGVFDDARRTRLLQRRLKGVLADYDGGGNLREGGRLQVERTFQVLKEAGVDTYDYLLCYLDDDWETLERVCQAAPRFGMSVWATIPPRPDFMLCAKRVAELSARYPALVAFNIDDFSVDPNAFPPEAVTNMVWEMRAISSSLAFLPTVYHHQISEGYARTYRPFVDGVLLPNWPKQEGQRWVYPDRKEWEQQLRRVRSLFPGKLLFAYPYVVTPGDPAMTIPFETLRETLGVSHGLADGIHLYLLPMSPQQVGEEQWQRRLMVKRLFGRWRKKAN